MCLIFVKIFFILFKTLKAIIRNYLFRPLKVIINLSNEIKLEVNKPNFARFFFAKNQIKILVRRTGALGDVVLTTPIIKKLREIHGYNAIINIATAHHNVYLNNPDINYIFSPNHFVYNYNYVYNLDLVYEKEPSRHIIDSYSFEVFGHTEIDKNTILKPLASDFKFVNNIITQLGVVLPNTIVIHCAVTAKNRTWPARYWSILIDKLTTVGYSIIIVGTGNDFSFQKNEVYNLVDKLTIHQVASLISISKAFIGNDSGMFHVAGTTDTPIFGLFTSAKGEYRQAFRSGKLGSNTTIIRPNIDCYGCLEKELPPVVSCDCIRGDYICLDIITPEMVFIAVLNGIPERKISSRD